MRKLVLCVTVGLAFLLGCSGAARERFKSWFFEIPEPPVETADKPAAPEHEPLFVPPPEAQYVSAHQPYTERKCAACHDREQSMQVREDLTESCRDCHERFFSDEVGHSPVEEGECAECHEAHRSEKVHLLKQPVYDTCIECHEEDELSEDAHEVDNLKDCTACHDAHFGTGALLQPGIGEGSSESD